MHRVTFHKHEGMAPIAVNTVCIPRNPNSIDWNARVESILSGNAKLDKTPAGVPAIVSGISMAPAKRSGVVNVCEHATPACVSACVLWFAGRTVTATVRQAAIARTMLWHFQPETFYARLRRELAAQERRALREGARSFVRLNTTGPTPPRRSRRPRSTIIRRTLNGCGGTFTGSCRRTITFHCRCTSTQSVHEHSTFADVADIVRAGGNVVVVVDSYYWGPSRCYGTLPKPPIRFRR